MRGIAGITTGLTALLLAGCDGPLTGAAPVLLGLEPATVAAFTATSGQALGRNFFDVVHVDVDDRSAVRFDGEWRAHLGGIDAGEARRVSASAIALTLPALAPGVYDLTLLGPSGRMLTLPAALTVVAGDAGIDTVRTDAAAADGSGSTPDLRDTDFGDTDLAGVDLAHPVAAHDGAAADLAPDPGVPGDSARAADLTLTLDLTPAADLTPAPDLTRVPIVFRAAASERLGGFPLDVAALDLDRDGRTDLVTLDGLQGNVLALLGAGDGTFRLTDTVQTRDPPSTLAVARYDGDQHADVLVIERNEPELFLGGGNGQLQARRIYNTEALGDGAASDLDSDGRTDLVLCTDSGKVLTALGRGDGTFAASRTWLAGGGALYGCAVADFNRDGKPDVVASSWTGKDLQVLLGRGDGSLAAATPYRLSDGCVEPGVGDLDGDGVPDLIAPIFDGDEVAVLLGKGDGTFGAPTPYANPCPGAIMPLVGDFDRDRNLDVVVTCRDGNALAVLRGDGGGRLARESSVPVGRWPMRGTTGDFNGDGRLDLAIATQLAGAIDVVLNGGP